MGNGGKPPNPLASWRCAPLRSPPGGALYNIGGNQKTRENGDMWSLARGIAQYSLKNSREYPKTSGAIPRGLRPLGIAPSVFEYSLSSFREYFAIHPRWPPHIATSLFKATQEE